MDINRRIKLVSLKSEKKFSDVYQNGKRIYSGNIILTISKVKDSSSERTQDINNEEIVEFAVVVGKRTSKSAVIRNRIKRLLRESIRCSFPLVFGDLEELPFNAMIITRRKAALHRKLIKFQEVNSEVFDAMIKARKLSKH